MPKVFSFASWNVEHFKNNRDRIRRNVEFIQDQDPDIFAIYEVEGSDVFDDFVDLMPTHNFYITEDLSRMETLVGVRRNITAFVTQRQKFKSQIPTLRPGTLATIHRNDTNYSVLFLHIKSADDPRSWGLRDDMIHHVRNLKKALDRRADGDANFICVGDLNTMGVNVTYADTDMDGTAELDRYEKVLGRNNMRLLSKTHEHTWWGGGTTYPPSNLDHAFASDHLEVRGADGAEIAVRGWPEKSTTAARKSWIDDHSDHALLYGEVWR